MSKGKWRARYFLITCPEVKFHCSCSVFFFFYETNVTERACNLIRFFCETRLKIGSTLYRWTYFAIQWRAWTSSSLGLMTVMADIWTTQPIAIIIIKIFFVPLSSPRNTTLLSSALQPLRPGIHLTAYWRTASLTSTVTPPRLSFNYSS